MRNIFICLLCMMSMSFFAQETLPCVAESFDTEKEMREIGVGKGENAFAATLNAVSYALANIKTRIERTYPEYQFIYETAGTSTAEGEQIEIETTFGQPNIICNEVLMPESDRFIVYLVLEVSLPENHTENPNDKENN